jgi:predicted DNA-binding transcriptional regulator AlpA
MRGERLGKVTLNFHPRLLRRERAAAYLDISIGCFDKLVDKRLLPSPKMLNSIKVWDRSDLDAIVDNLPYIGEISASDNSWND